MIAFEIPGEPVAFARAGSNGRRRFTPPRQAAYMIVIQTIARSRMRGSAPMEGPLEMQIRATYAPPPSWSKSKQASARWKTSVPDADNLAKLTKDALNGIAYRDDAQVASLQVQKVYGPVPGLTVTVQSLEETA